MYAEVIVHATVEHRLGDARAGIFTYSIPSALSGRLKPGHLVWVPLGSQRVQGVVLALTESAPPVTIRAIEGLVRSDPILTETQLILARWISQRYLAPLASCVQLMLPEGVLRRTDVVFELTTAPPYPSDLTEEQRALLQLLEEGAISRRRLRRQARHLASKHVVQPLLKRGLITATYAAVGKRARARIVRRVALVEAPPLDDPRWDQIGRASRQADVLRWLAATDEDLPTAAALCQAAGCRPALLRDMEKRGWVTLHPARKLLLIPDREMAQRALSEELGRAPAQREALRKLLDAPGPVDETTFRRDSGTGGQTLNALIQRGLVRRVEEPELVSLALPRDKLREVITELRGLQPYAQVLQALRAAGGEAWVGFLYAATGCTLDMLRQLERAGFVRLEEAEQIRDPLADLNAPPEEGPDLLEDQVVAWERLRPSLIAAWQHGQPQGDLPPHTPRPPAAFLIHGVTGSGKTELYLRAIGEALSRGRQAIVLVPEIALTPQAVQRFATRFPGKVSVWHSALSDGERFDLWRRIRRGEIDILIGSRSAIFAPMTRLGVIILDEEHEPAYKQERTPRYHAREVAMALGQIMGSPVILGSATPSLESYHAAKSGKMQLIELRRRIATSTGNGSEGSARYGRMPIVHIVDMRQELRAGNRSIFSRALQARLDEVLRRGEQAILFLNRRGRATFVMCRDCGFVLRCPRCDVPLTYHETTGLVPQGAVQGVLMCHHCGRKETPPRRCPQCRSQRIRYFGAGTQRVAEEVARLFPGARVLRWDRDTTKARRSHARILAQFAGHEADILIGTQMVAKGLDLPLVTLVGVIAADISLYLPDFRAAERTFQLLSQVAGRAGRSDLGGEVIVQTYTPEHYAIQTACRHDYEGFYARELRFRQELAYPPVARLARILCTESDPDRARRHLDRVAQAIRQAMGDDEDVALIGPVPCFFSRIRGRHRWQIILQGAAPERYLTGIQLPPACSVDVDPIELL